MANLDKMIVFFTMAQLVYVQAQVKTRILNTDFQNTQFFISFGTIQSSKPWLALFLSGIILSKS